MTIVLAGAVAAGIGATAAAIIGLVIAMKKAFSRGDRIIALVEDLGEMTINRNDWKHSAENRDRTIHELEDRIVRETQSRRAAEIQRDAALMDSIETGDVHKLRASLSGIVRGFLPKMPTTEAGEANPSDSSLHGGSELETD